MLFVFRVKTRLKATTHSRRLMSDANWAEPTSVLQTMEQGKGDFIYTCLDKQLFSQPQYTMARSAFLRTVDVVCDDDDTANLRCNRYIEQGNPEIPVSYCMRGTQNHGRDQEDV